MKHTPGKWRAKRLHIMAEGKTGAIGQGFVMNLTHDNTGKSIPDTEGEANAKLMAAAPELLKALQEMVDEFYAIDKHSFDIIQRAEQAIKNAID